MAATEHAFETPPHTVSDPSRAEPPALAIDEGDLGDRVDGGNRSGGMVFPPSSARTRAKTPLAVVREVSVGTAGTTGLLALPPSARGLVLFAHGSGSSRFSPRNRGVAGALRSHGVATLLLDLLHEDEEADRRNVFEISLLADRLVGAIDWIGSRPELAGLPLGLFGASTGAAAALVAAARRPDRVGAIVSRGGRPDLAAEVLDRVRAPTLLVVGGADHEVLRLNRSAYARLGGERSLVIVPDATHLFPEPGALHAVIDFATEWFLRHFAPRPSPPERGGDHVS